MPRAIAFAVVLVAVLAAPASATVDPGTLVVRQQDVPAGFDLVEGQSGVRSNARRTKEFPPALRTSLGRFGRLTGYQALYVRARPEATIASSVDVFRATDGVKRFIAWYLREASAANSGSVKPKPMSIGDQGWLTKTSFKRGSTRAKVAGVTWRHGRVLAAVIGLDVPSETVIRLARTQQRRIAAALG